ncbi:hypothetical protein D9619_005383 [Psilocybe cf. subviscida]|uniref:Uncharacterized protein n=1 Tax=Psilocybe cf. subviscida TaxID=2480587 RepID=A0A8H5BWW0_9AGAR|nr:hypothetical protein D9619_005383 [Psilocybe cf. subviscida]
MTHLRSPYTFAHQPSWLAETTAVTARLVDPCSICHPPILVVVTNSSLGRLIPPSPLLRDPLHNARPRAPLERESDPRPNDVAARPPFCLSLPRIGVRRELIMAKWSSRYPTGLIISGSSALCLERPLRSQPAPSTTAPVFWYTSALRLSPVSTTPVLNAQACPVSDLWGTSAWTRPGQ